MVSKRTGSKYLANLKGRGKDKLFNTEKSHFALSYLGISTAPSLIDEVNDTVIPGIVTQLNILNLTQQNQPAPESK